MNKFERLKTMNSEEAQAFIAKIVGEDSAKKFFVEEPKMIMAAEAEVGSFIKYAGIQWVVLEKTIKGVKVLSKHKLYDREFDADNYNNWSESTLRNELNKFNKGGWCCANEDISQINKNDLVEFERDLTTDDGITNYGKCKDYISLISCEEYRKYRNLIPNVDDWWWTLTPDSLVYFHDVRYVGSYGTLYGNDASGGNYGVRPLCVLKSDTEVKV